MSRQVLSGEWLRQHEKVVRRVLRGKRNTTGRRNRIPRKRWHEGYVDGDIAAGTGGSPSDGYVIVWVDSDTDGWRIATTPDGDDLRLPVKYKWDTAISDNTYCHIEKRGRHWQITAASCSAEV